MKKVNLILFIMFSALGIVNLSIPKNNPERQETFSNLTGNTESGTKLNNNLNMPVPPEDITGDGVADIDDLVVTLLESAAFCETYNEVNNLCDHTTYCSADLNQDCVADLTDVLIEFNYIVSQNCN